MMIDGLVETERIMLSFEHYGNENCKLNVTSKI